MRPVCAMEDRTWGSCVCDSGDALGEWRRGCLLRVLPEHEQLDRRTDVVARCNAMI